MPRYLISFDDGSMDHIPEQDWPAVGELAHAVVREAKAAGVWIFGGGVQRQRSSIVAILPAKWFPVLRWMRDVQSSFPLHPDWSRA